MGLNFFEVPRWVVILALFWYLHGWIFPTGTCMGGQKLYTVVHGWAWPHIPWYTDGSLFLQNWYMDGWWVVALKNSQRHTPTQTKVEYPPGIHYNLVNLFSFPPCVRFHPAVGQSSTSARFSTTNPSKRHATRTHFRSSSVPYLSGTGSRWKQWRHHQSKLFRQWHFRRWETCVPPPPISSSKQMWDLHRVNTALHNCTLRAPLALQLLGKAVAF